jgi:hypothetical protein
MALPRRTLAQADWYDVTIVAVALGQRQPFNATMLMSAFDPLRTLPVAAGFGVAVPRSSVQRDEHQFPTP